MNDMADQDALSETALRLALRLEDDERAPRLDAASIAVAAGRRTLAERIRRGIGGLALVGAGLSVEGLVAFAAFQLLAAVDPTGPLSLGLSLFAALAERVMALAAVTTNPSVGLAALAAVIFATIYERGTGRESMRVRAT
jgi:hypothetical protein